MRIRDIAQSRLNKKIKGFLKRPAFQNSIFKVIVIVVVWIIALVPTWFFIFIWWLASPEGFWQVLAFTAVGLFFCGGFQLILGIFAFLITGSVLFDEY